MSRMVNVFLINNNDTAISLFTHIGIFSECNPLGLLVEIDSISDHQTCMLLSSQWRGVACVSTERRISVFYTALGKSSLLSSFNFHKATSFDIAWGQCVCVHVGVSDIVLIWLRVFWVIVLNELLVLIMGKVVWLTFVACVWSQAQACHQHGIILCLCDTNAWLTRILH